jgi:signal transduction histidine kinase
MPCNSYINILVRCEMSETKVEQHKARFIADLRTLSVFSDLPEEYLAWLAERMDEVRFHAGEIYGQEGDPLDFLIVLLEGELQFERRDKPGSPLLTAAAPQVTGLLPFSRLTEFRGTARAVLPSRVLRLHKHHFPEMLQRWPVLAQRLVALMSDRIREVTRMETQQEKLMALGKLSAGLAHELNNPATAARRAAQNLKEAMENVRAASLKLLIHSVTETQRDAMLQFERQAIQSATSRTGPPADPLEQSDREEQLTSWLEQHGVEEAWKISPVLAEADVNTEKLDALVEITGPVLIPHALRRVAAVITIFGMIQEIDNSTRRISDLVTAIKRYSYMDQAPIQEVDLHEDLENTLKIFGHRLKSGVHVIREYDTQLPRVCAYGGELNQVWTNLIDNAIDAMGGKGELRIRTMRELDCAIVEIGDNGPGIPREIQSRIFDPFFTTKNVGEGTGLGLDTVMRIVRKHHGQIELKSNPGDTRFRVRLPFQQPKAQATEEESEQNSST